MPDVFITTPNRWARASDAEPYGSWSVIKRSDPPAHTHLCTAEHSSSVKADL